MTQSDSANRQRSLTMMASATAGLLAGCTGSSGGGNDDTEMDDGSMDNESMTEDGSIDDDILTETKSMMNDCMTESS